MEPEIIAQSYDQLAARWQNKPIQSYGIAQLERVIRFVQKRGSALDIGCGSQGRTIDLLQKHDFKPEGLDISRDMTTLARHRYPGVTFHCDDISRWNFPYPYDLIVAWDSTWHLPLELQEPVLENLRGPCARRGSSLYHGRL